MREAGRRDLRVRLDGAGGRDLTVVHGQGSVIHARPARRSVDLGGRCVVLDRGSYWTEVSRLQTR